MRSPSARKKYVENSTMKKPASTCPTAAPTSESRVKISPSWAKLLIASCARSRKSLIWLSLACSGPFLSQSVICPTPSLVLVGEVLRAVGHLLAGQREQE